MNSVKKDFIQSKFRMELLLIDRWDCLQQSVYIARALETISYRIGTRPKARPKEKLSQSMVVYLLKKESKVELLLS